MSALQKIRKKKFNNMTMLELAIWYTSTGTTAYNMSAAAELLAALEAVAQEARDLSDIAYAENRNVKTLDSALAKLDAIRAAEKVV